MAAFLPPTVLVDTGSDTTVLHTVLAPGLGFDPADLVPEANRAIGMPMTLSVPKDMGLIEVQIDRGWYRLPSIKFGQAPVSVLGCDFIFTYFELRMTATEFEFIPIAKKP